MKCPKCNGNIKETFENYQRILKCESCGNIIKVKSESDSVSCVNESILKNASSKDILNG